MQFQTLCGKIFLHADKCDMASGFERHTTARARSSLRGHQRHDAPSRSTKSRMESAFSECRKKCARILRSALRVTLRDRIVDRLTFADIGFCSRVHAPLSGVGVFSIALV
jgi:hypothetical protein